MSVAALALSGPPGSGKSTAGRLAASALALEFVSAGERFRAEATRRGLDLDGLSKLAETDASIDRALDDAMLALAAPGRLLDGRLVGALCRRRGIPIVEIRVSAREDVRAARLAGRDGVDRATALSACRAREASERLRYGRYYGIHLDREPTDLSIDSSEIPATEVARRIVAFVTEPRRPASP
ncbi:MAG: AAA family ATPase [Thermoplasmata archaeon]|nr:AAA family ATPase [Thermoplasmata archaeon]